MKGLRKEVHYCYPTSPRAAQLLSAGYYVAQSFIREDGTRCPPYPAIGNDVFDRVDDPDLLQLFAEMDGEPGPYSMPEFSALWAAHCESEA